MSDDEQTSKIPLSFKKHLNELTAGWKAALKRNKKLLLKCPNYEECQYKCSSIGGMQYHYARCSGTCPVFKCHLCGKSYESRTGLNYHNTSSHVGEAGSQTTVSSSDCIKFQDQEMERDVRQEDTRTKNWTGSNPDELGDSLTSVSRPLPPSPPVRLKPGPKPGHKYLHKSKHGPGSRVARQPMGTPPQSPPIVKRRGPGRRPKHLKEDLSPVNVSPVSSTGLGPPATTADVLVNEGSSVKKITITIPSIEYPDKYRSYLPDWRDELKVNQTVKCPNFQQCQFQCTTVNGMKYHFIRCQKEKLPEFKCSLCTRSFHCRSGLVWHLKNSHKVDMQSNKKTVQVMMDEETELFREAGIRGKRRRPLSTSLMLEIEDDEIVKQSSSTRKNDNPRRTSESFLRQMRCKPNTSGHPKRVYPLPPVPRLHSPPCRSPVPPIEFLITDAVPTDDDRRDSVVVDYSEEILTQWHKWYSDESDSEESEEWEPDEITPYRSKGRKPCSPREGLDSSAMSLSSGPSNPVSEDDDLEGGDHSSDEDYSCAAYKPVAKSRRGRRRGASNARNTITPASAITSSAVAAAVKIVQRTQLEVPPSSRLKPPPLKPIPPEETKPAVKIKVAGKPLSSASLLNTVKIASIAKPVPPVSVCKPGPKPVTLVKQAQPAHSIVLPQQQSSTQTVQYYQVPVQSMSATSGVLPIQLVSSVPGQSSYQIPAGSLVLLQHPGGQAQYAMLQTLPPGANSQHVSVIMNPGSGTDQAGLPSSSTSASYGFLTQLDGPKDTRPSRPRNTAQLRAEFESTRRHARLQSQPGPSSELMGGISPQSYPGLSQAVVHDHTTSTAFTADSLRKRMSLDAGASPNKRAREVHNVFSPLPMIGLSLPQISTLTPQQSALGQAWKKPSDCAHSEGDSSMSWLPSVESLFHPNNMPASSSHAAMTSSAQLIHNQLGRGFSSVAPSTQLTDTAAMFCAGPVQGMAQLDYTPSSTVTTPLVATAENSNNNGNDQAMGAFGDRTTTKKRGRPPNKRKKASKKVEEPTDGGVVEMQTLAAATTQDTTWCLHCGVQFLTSALLKAHVDTAHFSIPQKATIPDCIPLWKQALKAHKFVSCDRCGKFRAKSLTSIKYHYGRCGQEVEPISCSVCGKPYTTKTGLQYHMKTTHVDPPSPTSPVNIFSVPFDLAPRKAAQDATMRLNEMVSMHSSTPQSETTLVPSLSAAPSMSTAPSTTSAPSMSAAPSASSENSSPESVSLAKRMHCCPVCRRVFTGRKRIANHLRIYHPNHEVSDLSTLEVVGEKPAAISKLALPSNELVQIKAEIKEVGVAMCPHEHCCRTFKSHLGLYYHLKTLHSFFICPICSCMVPTWPKLTAHVAQTHPGAQFEEKDIPPLTLADVHPKREDDDEWSTGKGRDSTTDDDDSYVDEEEKGWNAEERRKRSERKAYSRQSFSTGTYTQVFEEIMDMITSKDPVFPNWSPDVTQFHPLSKSDAVPFLPVMSSSMQFSLSADWAHSSTLPLFTSHCPGSQDALFFVGGPVGAMEWVPVPQNHSQQYLALAAYKTLDETHQLQTATEEHGLIQLWSLGNLSNNMDSIPYPVFEMGVAHTFGWTRDIAWCPSGAWQDLVCDTVKGEILPRLGLMCVAFSDGKARIISFPHPDALRQALSASGSIALPLIVSLSLITCTLSPSCTDHARFGQCLCVSWMPQRGHSRIAGGFSNGTVCVWDLLSSLTFLQDSLPDGPVLLPQLVILAHSGPCRCLAWCPSQSNLIFTGGCDKMSCVWDLRQASVPLQKFERYWLSECHWPLMWCGVYVVEDFFQSSLKYAGLSFYAFMHFKAQGGMVHHNCVSSSAPILSGSYCKWTDSVVSASLHGEVKSNFFTHAFYNNPAPKAVHSKQKVLFSCSLERLWPDRGDDQREPVYGEVTMSDLCHTHKLVFSDKPTPVTYSHSIVPLMAVTKVRWNPCAWAHQWLVCGTNAGLVRLRRTTSKGHQRKQSAGRN